MIGACQFIIEHTSNRNPFETLHVHKVEWSILLATIFCCVVGADDASTARVNGLHVHQCGIKLLCSQKTANRKGGNEL